MSSRIIFHRIVSIYLFLYTANTHLSSIEFSFPNASVEERYPETLKRLESKGKRHALKRTLRIRELADKLAFGTSIISLAQSKYGFSPLFPPHTVKKRIPTEYLDSFGFALIALAAQRALAARLEQDTDSLFAKRWTFWQSVAALCPFLSLCLSLFTSRTPTSFIRIYIHGWDHRSWSGSRPITKTPLLLTFATTREGLVRDLPSSYLVVWFFLSQPGRPGSRFSHGRRHSYGIKSDRGAPLFASRKDLASLGIPSPSPSPSASSPFFIDATPLLFLFALDSFWPTKLLRVTTDCHFVALKRFYFFFFFNELEEKTRSEI